MNPHWLPRLALAAAGLLAVAVSAQPAPEKAIYRDPQMPVERRVEDLLGRMTLDEKIGQIWQGVVLQKGKPADLEAAHRDVRSRWAGAFVILPPPEKGLAIRNELQRIAVEETRLGIPLIFGLDSIHGFRTIFPIPLALGATWEPTLVEQAQAISARETRAAGIEWVFSPMCDTALDSRWGRVAETFGEDPFLNGEFVAASVRGFQGKIGDRERVAATLKHYVGYGASIGGRDYNETTITPFVLRNLHLPAFHQGVKAGALTLMSSFNANDGIPMVANHFTLTEVLRGEWGFRGFVVSDWEGVQEQIAWGYAADRAAAARLALLAGNDMEMKSTTYFETLAAQVRSGLVSQQVLGESVRRVLRVKFQLGLFEHPYTDPAEAARVTLRPEARALARDLAARSLVLLKNEGGVLPLSHSIRRIALVGPLGDDAGEMLGSWSANGQPESVITLAAGLRGKLPAVAVLDVVMGVPLLDQGVRMRTDVDGDLVVDAVAPAQESFADGIARAVKAAAAADVVIAALGEPRGWSGENASRAELTLTGRQQELLDAVAATGKPVVVLIFSGRPLVLPPVAARAAALVQAWHPGVEAGPGIADVLFGDKAPTGRLTISFPRALGQVPVSYNSPVTGRPKMRDFRDQVRDPLYPFGYGLTYTTFSYGPVEIVPASAGAPARVRARITNTGARAGEALPQLYVRDVACSEGARPGQELRGWRRVLLQPGESREVSFDLDGRALGYYSRTGAWRVEPGDFQVWIAPQAGAGDSSTFTLAPSQ